MTTRKVGHGRDGFVDPAGHARTRSGTQLFEVFDEAMAAPDDAYVDCHVCAGTTANRRRCEACLGYGVTRASGLHIFTKTLTQRRRLLDAD